MVEQSQEQDQVEDPVLIGGEVIDVVLAESDFGADDVGRGGKTTLVARSIIDSDDLGVFVDDARRDLLGGDPAEDAGRAHARILSIEAPSSPSFVSIDSYPRSRW